MQTPVTTLSDYEYLIGRPFKVTDCIIIFGCLSGIHYNAVNLVRGFWHSDDKLYAAGCLIPYVQFFGMMIASSYSRFYSTNVFVFIHMCGLYLLYATGIFNVYTMASKRVRTFYWEPIFFFVIVYVDYCFKSAASSTVALLYFCWYATTLFKYFKFMGTTIK